MHYDYKKMPETADKKIVETWMAEQFKKQEVLEYHTMLENLKVLDQWCEVNDEKEFFKYFHYFPSSRKESDSNSGISEIESPSSIIFFAVSSACLT